MRGAWRSGQQPRETLLSHAPPPWACHLPQPFWIWGCRGAWRGEALPRFLPTPGEPDVCVPLARGFSSAHQDLDPIIHGPSGFTEAAESPQPPRCGPHCPWANAITSASLPSSQPCVLLGFSHSPSSHPPFALGRQGGGSVSYFQDFKKAQRKSYIYLNEVPRLNKTLSLFALGWSHINSVW